jgi:hypothetical protein
VVEQPGARNERRASSRPPAVNGYVPEIPSEVSTVGGARKLNTFGGEK